MYPCVLTVYCTTIVHKLTQPNPEKYLSLWIYYVLYYNCTKTNPTQKNIYPYVLIMYTN